MTHLSDRMPEVAHGRDVWTAEDQAHLVGCDSCRSEWILIGCATQLGRDIDGQLDLEALTHRVAKQLGRAVQARRTRFRVARWFVPLAAAATLLIVFGTGRPFGAVRETKALTASVLLPELELLTEDDLELVFDVVPAAVNPLEQGIPGVSDLGEEELERLLQTLEG